MARYWLSFNLKTVTAIAVVVMMSGTFLNTRLDETKLPAEILNRSFGIGLRQIEYCLSQERWNELTSLFLPFLEDDFKCPIEKQR
jgi:hypothetical protein